MYLIAKGIAVGFSIAAPAVVIEFLCIQQTLKGGIYWGIASGLGAATADMMYGILIALGLKEAHLVLLRYQVPLSIFGGLFLCYLGVKKFFSSVSLGFSQEIDGGLFKAYSITFLLTLTNSTTILDFAALFTELRIDVTGYSQSFQFILGVFLGSATWWILLCCVVGFFRKKVSLFVLQYINYGAGLVLFAFGLYTLSRAYLLD